MIPRPARQVDARIKRRFKIRREDVLEHDSTPGCAGCKAAITGGIAVNHREECRDRFGQIFLDAEDERISREADRMATEESQPAGSSQDERAVPVMREVNCADDL